MGNNGQYEGWTDERKRLLYYRHVLKKKSDIATEGGITALTMEDRKELKGTLLNLAYYKFLEGDYEATKIRKAVELVKRPALYDDDIVALATRLTDRWDNGDFNPGPVQVLDELEDQFSSDEEEDSKSSSDNDDANNRNDNHSRVPGTSDVPGRGLMRGLTLTRSGKVNTWKLAEGFERKPADVFGSNGFEVGHWWPYQICALRDGAHGSRIGGIHGKISEGAYSVVISGGYEDNDSDHGDLVYYSGSRGGGAQTDQEAARMSLSPGQAPISNATRSLILSESRGKPVRVLRSSRGHSNFAPKVGIRYDGLYRVTAYRQCSNKAQFPFWRFELQRLPGQPKIDCLRPSEEEKMAFAALTRKE